MKRIKDYLSLLGLIIVTSGWKVVAEPEPTLAEKIGKYLVPIIIIVIIITAIVLLIIAQIKTKKKKK